VGTLLTGIGALYSCPEGPQEDAGLLRDAAVYWQDGVIEWTGRRQDAPRDASCTLDAGGAMVVPGLVDCHTHLAFGGWRADEFAMRIEGRNYLEIARAGGGIASTVRATRAATRTELHDKARAVLDDMLRLGVTTVECKSGYGLTTDDELRLLRVYRDLDASHPMTLVSTFLGAHVVPPEHRDAPERYVAEIMETMLPAVAAESLASFCDVFVEDTAFSVEQARAIFAAAKRWGLGAKLHADQMTNTQGAALAAEVGAVSADHLEQSDHAGLVAMARAGVTAVTLPLASLYTFQSPWDARVARAAGVEVAVASDFNPGSAPSSHLPLAMMLACTMNRMTPAAALQGATRVAARAVGRSDEIGRIERGMRADMAVLNAPSVEHWLYQFRGDSARATIKAGEIVWGSL
jgi:imidazolonepropionase